jgi:Glycosyltransferase
VKGRRKFFNDIDIFIFPSFSEGLGLVLLEAMSYSKICITRDIKPMNTYIDSDTGYLFNNVDSLVQKINLAINDIKKDYSVIEKKLSNIDKKLEKSRVEKIFPKFQEVYKNE